MLPAASLAPTTRLFSHPPLHPVSSMNLMRFYVKQTVSLLRGLSKGGLLSVARLRKLNSLLYDNRYE